MLFGAVIFLPESPVWLMSKNKIERAKHSKEWLRLESIASAVPKVEEQPKSEPVSAYLTRPILMPLCIGLTLLVIQQVSGIDAVIFFTVDIFRSSGKGLSSLFVKCIFSYFAFFLNR